MKEQGKGFDPYTVRHAATGLYLSARQRDVRIGAIGTGLRYGASDLVLAWRCREEASIMTLRRAAAASTAYIVLTGDHDVEIEPVEEV